MGSHAHLYKLAVWVKTLRPEQLASEPLCRFCAAKGITTVATVADHIEPHRGDRQAFLTNALQSLCKTCHDGDKQREERRGFNSSIGQDGWPIDARHPFNNTDESTG